MSRRRRSSSSSRGPKLNLPIILGAVVAFVGLIGATLAVVNSTPPRRGEDLCRTDAGPAGVVVVVVDASGEFSPVQQTAMLDRFYRALERVAPSDEQTRPVAGDVRVDVYNANAPVGELIEPVFSRCSTPRLRGLQALAGNVDRENRTYRTEFAQPLDDAMRRLVAGDRSSTSPILESLSASVERSLSGRSSRDIQAVVVLSDMLQNSDTYTFYGRGGVPSFQDFYLDPAHNAVSLDLRGASFCPIVINRDNAVEDALQSAGLSVWWEQYAAAYRGRFELWCLQELQL